MKITSDTIANGLVGCTCLVMIAVGAVDLHDRLLAPRAVASQTDLNSSSGSPQARTQAPSPVDDVTELTIPTTVGVARSTGSPKVALVEFSDFECPFCRRHATSVYDDIKRNFVDNGKVAYVFINYPRESLHPNALSAASAFECAAEQQRPWEMHDKLFEGQVPLGNGVLLSRAKDVGLEMGAFQRCLAGEGIPKVRAELALGDRAGIRGTPSFLVGQVEANGEIKIHRRITGSVPYNTFKAELEAALAQHSAIARR